MNVLIVANHYAVCSARYAADAFTRLGHTVRHIGPDMGRRIWGLDLPQAYVWKSDSATDWSQGLMRPLTIVMDSDPVILDGTGKAWSQADMQMVVWGVDNHVRNYRRDWFTHYFLAHGTGIMQPWTDDMTHLPCAYDPVYYTPSPIPWEKRAYDVAVLGVMYPPRLVAVKALLEAGLKVIWGCGAVYEMYRDLHHNSRIALNLSACGDVNQRIFETAAMGNVVMTDDCYDFPKLQPDGVWVIENTSNIVGEALTILSDPAKAQEMVQRSLAWVKPHTWDARALQIVEWYERTWRNGQTR